MQRIDFVTARSSWLLTQDARYSGMGFLSGLWMFGFNPLSFDLAFVQIPFLEQVTSASPDSLLM
jgi:hypothetical protein